jgi:predicted ATPase
VNAYFQNAGFVGELELEFEQQLGRTYYLGPLRSNPRRQYSWAGSQPRDVGDSGQQAVEALLASELRGKPNHRKVNSLGHALKKISVEEHVAQWLKELDLISSFSVEALAKGAEVFQVLVQRTAAAPSVLLTDIGFGVSQILPVLVLLAYVPTGSTVILEQPEIHLHPAVQAGLADVLIEAATIRNVQVIVESHSEHLLRRLQRRVAEGIVRPEEFSLYFCDLRKGESIAERLDLNIFGAIENWPAGFFGDPFTETAVIAREGLRRRTDVGYRHGA